MTKYGSGKVKKIVALFLAIFLIGFISGCAKDVGEDQVPVIANVLHDASESLAEIGLKMIKEKSPSQYEFVLGDLQAIIGISQGYSDGIVSIDDLRNTVVIAVNDLNTRFSLIDSEYKPFIDFGIKTIANVASIWFVDKTLPEDVVAYVNALSTGIENGIKKAEAGGQ